MLPGFISKEIISENDRFLIIRGEDEKNALPVVMKIFTSQTVGSEEATRFFNEFRIGKLLKGVEGANTCYEFRVQGKFQAIIMEDIGGSSLDKLFVGPVKDIKKFLEVAIKAEKALSQIHQARIIHKDIKPQNIIYNFKTGEIRIIDFSISSQFDLARVKKEQVKFHEGTLGYISPEQIGQVDREIDFRSDLYSLGATFYVLLTGRKLFNTRKFQEIVNAHLYKMPPSPARINSFVPESLSHIVMKLLTKNVSFRYQSGYGLRRDLGHCLESLERIGHIKPFPLGEYDIPANCNQAVNLEGSKNNIKPKNNNGWQDYSGLSSH